MTDVWARCGHPRTPENSKRVGWNAVGAPKMACLQCQRASTRLSLWNRYRPKRARRVFPYMEA